MEPLFRLDIDILLTSIKQKLMQHDENAQVACMQRLSDLFQNGGAASKEAVLSKFIKFDLLSTVFEILQTSTESLLPYVLEKLFNKLILFNIYKNIYFINRCVLDFLNVIIVYRKFYDYHIAKEAMDSILKITVCILKSRSKGTQLIHKLVTIIFNILQR
uniref:uncharacterized protein LOC117608091 isoform X1 n=1 Tax=Osmia lignaria TaxID=473952 RepID=UPI0014784C59|nr:uncharacterized protein LOC117608091 isoform X1 [Osmia lignaria]